MEEVWRDIYFIENGIEYDYRGKYQVSNLGNVRALNYMRTGEKHLLSQTKNTNDYLLISLWKNNKKRRFMVHRLVAHMFCNGYKDGLEVNHKDQNPLNNTVENLEWCSHEYNLRYGNRIKKQAKKISRKVIGYSLTDTRVIILQSTRQGKKFGFCQSSISACCRGEVETHKGYHWKYIEEEEKELD